MENQILDDGFENKENNVSNVEYAGCRLPNESHSNLVEKSS